MADTAVVVVDGAAFGVPRAHLARALADHLRWCRTNGLPAPAEIVRLVEALSGPERTTRVPSPILTHDALMEPHAVTISAAAARLGVSERTIRRMISDGRLPARRYGRAVRIPVSALEVA